MMIKIREAAHVDLPVILEVGRKTFTDSFGKDNTAANMKEYLDSAFNEEQIRAELEDPGARFFLAFEETCVAGYAKMRVSDEVHDQLGKRAIELQRLYVMQALKGRGIGRELLATCLRYAANRQFDWMWLGVWEKNYPAQRFYSHAGFQKFGEHFFDMGDDRQTDWLMRRKIHPE